ncbi:GNAT family N-acetyltransferase [Ilumatobacter nonamiensis]|uniref:GNAT family N-acetyltransferase n=1 Tax=Ilumatobacter nonamiensis TaxID=467093 RepID=UPI0011D207E6|nr:GNAT family N-acetyltransferase [Ilumatobacter nonamiensis]
MATRVLWVVKGLGPGGAETLLEAAARAHDSDFEIECAFVLPWKDHLVGRLEEAGVRTRCVSKRRSDPQWPLNLARLVRNGNYDVVHVHSPLPGSVARLAVRSMPAEIRPGLVSTEHNRWETHRSPTRTANRLTSRLDDAAFAVTDEVRESMKGPDADLAVTLRHGIDVDAVAAETVHRAEVRDELGIGADEFVVGTVANFRPQKDYPNLLAAARLLAEWEVPVRIVAVGQGPQEAEVRAIHERYGLGDRVILTGFRPDATRVMGACDAFMLASQWEGLPVAVMEAVALGLPLVATEVGGLAEEFSDGVDALLVPPRDSTALADAIGKLVTDSDLRERLALASRRRSADFSIDRTVAELEAAYRRIARHGAADSDGDQHEPPTATASHAPRRRGPELDIRTATPDDRGEIIALLQRSLGSDGDPRYPALFAWKHDENRFGPSPMWVAVDGERIVAIRALMRWEFVRGGTVLRAVRAVDTATDPDYQGRGLFRALTMHGLEAVRAEGVDFVFNTPNDQSRPGYLKMGWREVGRLPAAVRFVGPGGAIAALRSRVPADRWSLPLGIGESPLDWLDRRGPDGRSPEPVDVREFRTNVDDRYLAWRFGTELLGYRVVDDGDAAVIVRARRRGSATELAVVSTFGPARATDRLAGRAAKEAGADYAIRLGQPQMSSGFNFLPGGGPVLTWRAVTDRGMPPLSNWAVSLGDIELF